MTRSAARTSSPNADVTVTPEASAPGTSAEALRENAAAPCKTMTLSHDPGLPFAHDDTPKENPAGPAALDPATSALVRLAAVLAAGSEGDIRIALQQAIDRIDPVWVEELILQTYLFAGFPRALNSAREWRRLSGRPAPAADPGESFDITLWQEQGEATCATVYGRHYDALRHNIRALHPALDAWMIVEGYGKVLSRPELALWRRELCIVTVCAVARQDRQLHSHLLGALNAGASPKQIDATLAAISDLVSRDDLARYTGLWARVQGK